MLNPDGGLLCLCLCLCLWRHGSGLAGTGDISHRGFVGWRSVLWCSFLLWSLPVLQRWSSPLVASICSAWSSPWLILGNWWGWLLGSSGTAAGCLSGPRCWPFSSLPDLVAECLESIDYSLFTCLDQFCWDVVDSSWLPFLQWLYCSFHFFAKDGVVILCVCLGTV